MPTVDFGGGGGSSFTAQNISADTTLATFDLAFVDASGGARTITMPSSPSDGDAVQIVATSTSGGNIDVSANTGQSVSGLTTLQNSGEAAVFRYRASDSTWYGTTADVLDRFVDRSTGEVTAPINSQSASITQGHGFLGLPTHHVNYASGLTDEELARFTLASGDVLEVWRLEAALKGGGSNANVTLAVRDVTNSTTLASVTGGGRSQGGSSPLGTSGAGATIIVRLSTGSSAVDLCATGITGVVTQ